MEPSMPVNLSVKNVPDALADRLRARAERNHRSLQRELLSILESATAEGSPSATLIPAAPRALSIEEVVARARKRFPYGTPSSIADIRAMRDGR
jgi:plasmid stability protein